MSNAILALDMWSRYAPKFCLTLDTDAEMSEVCALDKEQERFVPIARGTDSALVIIEACERLATAMPGKVSELEIPGEYEDQDDDEERNPDLICIHFQRLHGGECVARSHVNVGPCAGSMYLRVVVRDLPEGGTDTLFNLICEAHGKEETAQFNHEGTTYKVRDNGEDGWSVVPMKIDELPD